MLWVRQQNSTEKRQLSLLRRIDDLLGAMLDHVEKFVFILADYGTMSLSQMIIDDW